MVGTSKLAGRPDIQTLKYIMSSSMNGYVLIPYVLKRYLNLNPWNNISEITADQ